MNQIDANNGRFDISDTKRPPNLREQSVMANIINKIGAPLAALAMFAINPSCTKEDLQNARTQIYTPDKPSAASEEDPSFDCDPFKGCFVMPKDQNNQFFLTFGVEKGSSVKVTFNIIDKDGNVLASVTDTVTGGRKLKKEGLFAMEKPLLLFSEYDVSLATDIVAEWKDENGLAHNNTWSIASPTAIADADD